MSRTYIKLNVQMGVATDVPGGAYLDAISSVHEYAPGRTAVTFGRHAAIVNETVEQVEKRLAEAHRDQPAELDWREITGMPELKRQPKGPKKGLGRFFPG